MTGILPGTDEPETAPFWEAAREGRLVVQKLADGRVVFPPRHGHPDATWQEISGKGRVWSYVTVHGPTLPAYADSLPFPVAVIELDDGEGLRMVGNLVKEPGAPLNSLDSGAIEIGQPVELCFSQVADDVALPCWVPVQ